MLRLLETMAVVQRRQCRGCCQRSPPERLQNPDVEHIMNACPFWHRQAVGNVADPLSDLERSGETWTQLAPLAQKQRLDRSKKNAQPHQVTHRKLKLAMVTVIVALRILLCLEKTFTDVREERIPVLEQRIHGVWAS